MSTAARGLLLVTLIAGIVAVAAARQEAYDLLIVGGLHRGAITVDGPPSLSLQATSDEPTPFYWIIRLGSQ